MNTKPDKYDEVAENIQALYHQGVYVGETEKISAILRSAFPPPAEDASIVAVNVMLDGKRAITEKWSKDRCDQIEGINAQWIESFAQSRVEPWREVLEAFECWWRLPNIARSVETIEPAMRKCLALLADSTAKEAAT